MQNGFRIALEASLKGQKIIELKVSKNGLGFSGLEGSHISEIVHERSENEGAVKVAKSLGYSKSEFDKCQSFEIMNETWKAFSF